MKFKIILLILKLITQASTNGPGIIFVNFISYQNPAGKTDKGVECDSWFNQFVQDKCDLVFSICLEDIEKKNFKYPCDIGSLTTLNHIYHNTPRVKFDTTIGFIPNPFNFTVKSIPDNIKIQINVTDDDMSGQDLISRLQHVIQLPVIGVDDDSNSIKPIILSSKNSEMVFKVFSRCQEYYYGPGCKQFCKPSASKSSGFYACDRVTGEKHCLIGWTGNECRQRDLCLLDDPCHGSGQCSINNHSTVECICPHSLTGQYCQIPKRPCDSSPCVNGGLCVLDPDSSLAFGLKTLCICPRNFTGKNCQYDVDECEMFPCKHEATCVNSYGSYVCNCKNNHWGVYCEKPPVFSVLGLNSAYMIKSSTARFMQNMIIVLLIAVICLILIIGLLSFLYYKNRSRTISRAHSAGSVYSECHFGEKTSGPTGTQVEDDDMQYENYYELENEINLKAVLKEDSMKCFEKESVI